MTVLVAYATRHGATTGIGERLMRLMPKATAAMPVGDFRDWEAIDAWAREIAAQIQSSD